jgi:hypothetical protein
VNQWLDGEGEISEQLIGGCVADEKLSELKIYEAIQKGISDTDAISFRLIGLVPLVSATGLLTIVLGLRDTHVLPLLSIFAAAVTLGILGWELWNIQTCHWYINFAHELERRTLKPLALPDYVIERPGRPPANFGKHNAAKVIYATTIATWLVLPTAMKEFWNIGGVLIGLYCALALIIVVVTFVALKASTDPAAARKGASSNTYEAPVCQETDVSYERILAVFWRL